MADWKPALRAAEAPRDRRVEPLEPCQLVDGTARAPIGKLEPRIARIYADY